MVCSPQVKTVFDRVDRDGDGVVTESEWGALLGPQGWTALTDLRNKLTK
jgi:hypothetical protein